MPASTPSKTMRTMIMIKPAIIPPAPAQSRDFRRTRADAIFPEPAQGSTATGLRQMGQAATRAADTQRMLRWAEGGAGLQACINGYPILLSSRAKRDRRRAQRAGKGAHSRGILVLLFLTTDYRPLISAN